MSHSPPERATIMVIDDSEVVLEVTKGALERAGFRVITRERSSGSVNLLIKEKPDLVLIDVNMPLVAGDMIATLLRRAAPNSKTIILFYSSLSAEELRSKVASAGAHGYIRKTGNTTELVRHVLHWLRKSSVPTMAAVGERSSAPDALTRAEEFSESVTKIRAAKAVTRASQSRSASSGAAQVVDDPSPTASGTLRVSSPVVLLVDEDPRILAAYRRELEHDEFLAEFTDSPHDALRRVMSHVPPDVLVCDLLMQAMSGMELFARAAEHDASWRRRFVFVTGAAASDYIADFPNDLETRVLAKPVDFDRLRRAIRFSALGAPSLGRAGQSQRP